MTSPRKFAEKIALLQQKQAQDDAAFNTILNEVEAAKQVTLFFFFFFFLIENVVFRRENVVTRPESTQTYRIENTRKIFIRKPTERRMSIELINC